MLRYASDRRHLDELLHTIVAAREELSYEITDSAEHGPLGLPLATTIEFTMQGGSARAVRAAVEDAIEAVGASGRFEPLSARHLS
jgi:hypothetical protein